MTRPHPRLATIAIVALLLTTIIIVAIAIVTSPGCIDVNRTGPSTQPGVPSYVVQLENEIRADANLATATYILIAKTDDERGKRAVRIQAIAQQVKAGADSGVDIADLRELAVRLILRNADEDDRVAANVLLNAIIAHVKLRLGLDVRVTIIPPTMLPDARRLIRAAAEEAENVSGQFVK
jgi:hypothetical protein